MARWSNGTVHSSRILSTKDVKSSWNWTILPQSRTDPGRTLFSNSVVALNTLSVCPKVLDIHSKVFLNENNGVLSYLEYMCVLFTEYRHMVISSNICPNNEQLPVVRWSSRCLASLID